MTQQTRLYYTDSKLLQHRATVVKIDGNIVQLDSTIFHPQGGGQPSDLGTINGISVVKVSESSNGAIFHLLETSAQFKTGEQVILEVDEIHRKLFTRLHSAGHLIAHVAERQFPSLKAIQGHHFPNEARVEFKYEVIPNLNLFKEELMAALQIEINNDSQVISKFEDSIRKIVFGDFTATPCGGTHVNSLAEISGIFIRNIKHKDGKIRVGYDVV